MERFYTERITDISNELCQLIDAKKISRNDLMELYKFHKSKHHIFPSSNWMSHRIRVLSCIATALDDIVKIWECHYWVLLYYYELSVCQDKCGAGADYHFRDSLNYVVYGFQALVNACLYLQPITKYNYKPMFDVVVAFLNPYLTSRVKHIEFQSSALQSDSRKAEYLKPWNPLYASTFLLLLQRLNVPPLLDKT